MNTTKRVGNPHVINSFRKVVSEKYIRRFVCLFSFISIYFIKLFKLVLKISQNDHYEIPIPQMALNILPIFVDISFL